MNIKIVIYFSALFFLSELVLMIVKRSKKKGTEIKNDNKSLLLFWITIPVSLSLGFYAANYHQWGTLQYSVAVLGLGIFVIGVVLRWVSIIQLKKEFTVDVAILKDHQLKTNGLYKKIRHPSYLGLLLICFGLSIAMNSIISLLVITIPIFLALAYRIKTEENILMKVFGESYKDYKKTTYRMIPGVY